MAFSEAQQEQIRAYLGYPPVQVLFDTFVEGSISLAGASDTLVATVAVLLGQIANIQTLIANSADLAGLKAATGSSGNAEFDSLGEGRYLRDLRNTGRMLCGQLAFNMTLPKNGDFFSTRGPRRGYTNVLRPQLIPGATMVNSDFARLNY